MRHSGVPPGRSSDTHPREMRSSAAIVVLGLAVLASSTGCVSFSTVRYPGQSDPTSPPGDIRIFADKRQELAVALVLQSTNRIPCAASAADSSLSDDRGRQYALELKPAHFNPAQDVVGNWVWSWFMVRAYGPLPGRAPLEFASGNYDISIAYAKDGGRRVAAATFEVKRRAVPFFVAWFGLIAHPVGP